jgi:hypothetical protein
MEGDVTHTFGSATCGAKSHLLWWSSTLCSSDLSEAESCYTHAQSLNIAGTSFMSFCGAETSSGTHGCGRRNLGVFLHCFRDSCSRCFSFVIWVVAELSYSLCFLTSLLLCLFKIKPRVRRNLLCTKLSLLSAQDVRFPRCSRSGGLSYRG